MHASHAPDSTSAPRAERRAYVKPEFRHEHVFETMALACGKVSTTQNSCRTNQKNS